MYLEHCRRVLALQPWYKLAEDLFVCMYVSTYVCMNLYVYTYVCMHIGMYTYVCMHMCMCTYVCMHMCMCVCVCVCVQGLLCSRGISSLKTSLGGLPLLRAPRSVCTCFSLGGPCWGFRCLGLRVQAVQLETTNKVGVFIKMKRWKNNAQKQKVDAKRVRMRTGVWGLGFGVQGAWSSCNCLGTLAHGRCAWKNI